MSTSSSSIDPLPPQIARIVSGESEPDGQALCELREHLKHLCRNLEEQARPELAKLAEACNRLVDPLLRTGSANLDHVLIAVSSILHALDALKASVDSAERSAKPGSSTRPIRPSTPVAHTAPLAPSGPAATCRGGLSLNDHELEEEFGKLLEAVRTGARAGGDKAFAGEGSAASSGLQMVNKRRLGEILVSLAMINRDDLETALRMQKVTGRRVGETLLEMGLLTPAQLENALRTQGT